MNWLSSFAHFYILLERLFQNTMGEIVLSGNAVYIVRSLKDCGGSKQLQMKDFSGDLVDLA